MAFERFVFRVHAIQRMYQRRISEDEVQNVIQTGETIEDYPDEPVSRITAKTIMIDLSVPFPATDEGFGRGRSKRSSSSNRSNRLGPALGSCR